MRGISEGGGDPAAIPIGVKAGDSPRCDTGPSSQSHGCTATSGAKQKAILAEEAREGEKSEANRDRSLSKARKKGKEGAKKESVGTLGGALKTRRYAGATRPERPKFE
jgi:hypothetical protein